MLTKEGSRNLAYYAAANAVSRFGSQFQFMTVTVLTYAITNSALATALQMAVTSLPFILLARWAGAPADRHDPRKVVITVSLIQAVLTLFYLLSDQVAWIVLLNFLRASAGVFLAPARATLVPQMVGREHLLRANGRLAAVGGAVELVSPALAGFLLVRTSTTVAFLFNAASFLFPAAAMLLVRLVEPVAPAAGSGVGAGVGAGAGAGKAASAFGSTWAFLRERRSMITLLAGYGAYMLGMWAVNAIFYPYTREILHGDADVLGWSISAYFGAYTLTGFVMERWGNHLRQQRLLFAGYLVGAAVWVGYAFTRSIPVAILLSAFDGIVYTYAVTLFETRIQEEAPPESRGRIFGVVRAYDEATTASGQVLGGAMATYAGVLPGIRLSAGLTTVLVALVAALAARGGGRRSRHGAV